MVKLETLKPDSVIYSVTQYIGFTTPRFHVVSPKSIIHIEGEKVFYLHESGRIGILWQGNLDEMFASYEDAATYLLECGYKVEKPWVDAEFLSEPAEWRKRHLERYPYSYECPLCGRGGKDEVE